MKRVTTSLAIVGAVLVAAAAEASEPFEKLWCLRYAVAPEASLSILLAGVSPDERADIPFTMCAAQRGDDVVVLDAGFVNRELGTPFAATDWAEYPALLAEVGLRPEAVDYVTLSHMHFDHAGGTSRFPKAKFIVQRRELEYAAGALPGTTAPRRAPSRPTTCWPSCSSTGRAACCSWTATSKAWCPASTCISRPATRPAP